MALPTTVRCRGTQLVFAVGSERCCTRPSLRTTRFFEHQRTYICRSSEVSSTGGESVEGPASTSGRTGNVTASVAFPVKLWRSLFPDKATVKEQLAAFGVGAFAAYGLISNINASIIASLSWLTVVKQTSHSPLYPGNWKVFLAVYAGMWVTAGFMRPLRLSLALAAAPAFNKGIDLLEQKLQRGRPAAVAALFFLIASGSVVIMALCIGACTGFRW